MATVTKPIALDESLNTTELSSRNVADVLAQELQAVAGAIGGIAVPSADHVSYDNSVSGLSATDVQNALDEIVSDIPTVNNGTLTIQQNGTSKGSFTANSASNVNVNIETPTADKKTATDQFNTADGGLLSKCQINLVPVQSGSGDPSPDNVRPISGHTEVDLDVKDGEDVTQHTYQVSIGSTVYGGYVDLVSGVMTVTHALIDYDGSEDESWAKNSTMGYRITISDCKDESFANSDCITNEFTKGESAYYNLKCGITHRYFTIGDTNSTKWADVTALKTWLSSNPLQVVYELATPQTIQLTPQQIETLSGQNNLSTPLSGQSIETNGVEYKELFTFADVKEYVDKKIPDAPTTDGTYTLQAVVSGGVPTYSWV